MIDSLYLKPITIGNVLYDWTRIMTTISQIMYDPRLFPYLAQLFDLLLRGGDTSSAAALRLGPILIKTDYKNVQIFLAEGQSLTGIHCLDNDQRVSTLDEFLPAAEKLHNISRDMAPTASFSSKTCPQ
jgi:hypothetical protein